MNLSWFKIKRANTPSLERVLLIHPFGIGDALFITPLIRSLKESGVKRIDLLLGSRTREIFELNPYVNQIYEWERAPISDFRGKWRYRKKLVSLFGMLWRNRYQAAIDFTPKAKYALLSRLIFWIPIRIGFSYRNRGFSLTHKRKLVDGYSERPVAEYYNDLVVFLNVLVADKQTELFLHEEDRQEAQTILNGLGFGVGRSYLVVSPGGGESWGKDARLKRWPVKYFAGLLRGLHRSYPSLFDGIFILGGEGECSLCAELLAELNGISAYDLCGAVSIRVAGALIEKALFFLGNDGGLVHVAHALNTPIVALYGPVDPTAYGPYPPSSKVLTVTNEGPACRPCYQHFRYQVACRNVECLTHLTVEDVLEEIQAAHFIERLNLAVVSK